MGRKHMTLEQKEKRPPVYCDYPGCVDADKNLHTLRGLDIHKFFKHQIPYKIRKPKNIKEYSMPATTNAVEEVSIPVTVTDGKVAESRSQEFDFRGLEQKIDTLTKMIPPDFCVQFPNLCKLGERVTHLEQGINDVKDAIPKKITVQIPKISTPSIPAPIVDIQALSKDLLPKLKESMIFDVKPISDVMSNELTKLTEVVKGITKTNDVQEQTEELLAAALTESNNLHKTPDEYFDCPECRQSLLTALEKRINDNKERDPEVVSFLNSIKNTFILEGGHKHEHHERSNSSTTTTNGRGNKGEEIPAELRPQESPDKNQTGSSNSNTSDNKKTGDTPTSGSDTTPNTGREKLDTAACKNGWCLLRRSGKRD